MERLVSIYHPTKGLADLKHTGNLEISQDIIKHTITPIGRM
jgi:hypothetical protein